MNQEELARAAEAFEAHEQLNTEKSECHSAEGQKTAEETIPHSVVQTETGAMPERFGFPQSGGFGAVVGNVEDKILSRAQEKFSDDKIVDKHAESLKRVADRALEAQAEQASLTVQEQEADNKVRKQEIRNKLIVLKAEAKRLKREQKQLTREQREDHKARNKAAKWELYKDKLERMHYTYVPCGLVLTMLLFFDGIISFFDGLGAISTAIVKALKWVLLIGIILGVLFAIPVTRDWLINLLSGEN